MRILITGGRDWADRDTVWRELDSATAGCGLVVVVHGACHLGGADIHADQWASASPNATAEPHPASDFGDWPDCGPRRNRHMVRLGADMCLAFPTPQSRGTWDCVRKARRAGIPTRIVRLSSDLPHRRA